MKGYIKNGKCYIFPQTADEIPAVEATAFYVQEENFTEWVAENESIADKLVKYNYNLISVQPKEWAGHENDDLEPPVTTYSIAITGAYAPEYTLNKNEAEENDAITITPSGSSYTAQWVDMSSAQATVTWDNSNSIWGFTMPAEDVTVTSTARTLYEITKSGDYTSEFTIQPANHMPETYYEYDSYVYLVPVDASVNPTNGYTMAVVTTNSDQVSVSWDGNESKWYFAQPNSDVVATMTYEAPALTYSVTVTTEQDFPAQGLSYGPANYEENAEVNIVFEGSTLPQTSDYEIVCSDADLAFSMEWYWQEEVTDEITGEPTGETIDHWPILTFTMPAENITFTLQSIPTYNITWSGDYSSLVDYYGLGYAHVGDSLAFNALENVDLYNDYTCSVVDSNSDPVTLDGPTSDYNALAFTMPASEVTITITPINP